MPAWWVVRRPVDPYEPRWRGVAGRLGAVLVIVAVVFSVVYYRVYRRWPFDAATYPDPLRVCGRNFQPDASGVQTRRQIAKQGNRLVHVGDTPGWFNRRAVWTYDTGDVQSEGSLAGGCQAVSWTQGGPDAFPAYELEGSP